MILYLDTSAVVKKYVSEPGSAEVIRAIGRAEAVGCVLITRVEFAAAIGKAVRIGVLVDQDARAIIRSFHKEWASYYVGHVGTSLVSRAEALAGRHPLRGYDAIHLAAASAWQEDLGETVSLATFDLNLWRVAGATDLVPYPEDLPGLLQEWKQAGERNSGR